MSWSQTPPTNDVSFAVSIGGPRCERARGARSSVVAPFRCGGAEAARARARAARSEAEKQSVSKPLRGREGGRQEYLRARILVSRALSGRSVSASAEQRREHVQQRRRR